MRCYAPIQPVPRIPRVVRQIELRRQSLTIFDQYLDVYVWRTAGIRHRLYGAKRESPIGFADIVAVALEAAITRRPALVAMMQVAPVHIALPDLDARPSDRFSAAIEHPAGERDNFATGLLDLVRDLDQITIDVIQSHPCRRVERSFTGRRRRLGCGEPGNG